jgi:hypothetical protein
MAEACVPGVLRAPLLTTSVVYRVPSYVCCAVQTQGEQQMKKIMVLAVAGLALGACNSPGERAVGGALIGGGAGALLGGAVAGSRGVAAGAAIGALSGAVIGAATTPDRRSGRCPRGTYLASDGYCYRY